MAKLVDVGQVGAQVAVQGSDVGDALACDVQQARAERRADPLMKIEDAEQHPRCGTRFPLRAASMPTVLFAVARDAGGESLGCGAIVVKPGYGEIKRMYVRPQARGQGLARRLIDALEQKAMARGCRRFMLETGPAQPEALILYERLGYRRCGAFGDYPEDPFSVFMQKTAP